jgi:biopolymer transport protein ExbD
VPLSADAAAQEYDLSVQRYFTLSESGPPFQTAFAGVVLVILFALYGVPYGAIVCGGAPVDVPDVSVGSAYFATPDTLPVWIKRDGTVFVGFDVVPQARLYDVFLSARRLAPRRTLELRVDRHAKFGGVAEVLKTARQAGYDRAYVFGLPHSILQLSSKGSGA